METKRRYTQRKRARSQEQTRRRIVEATMQLHEELGPRATTISAIAERAGVQRLTVYRHFPDETAIFQACTAHWLALNPPPDPAAWSAVPAGPARLRAALEALYPYYRRTRAMWDAALRDEPAVPALQAPMGRVRGHFDNIAGDLADAFAAAPERRAAVAATVRHVLRFETWQSLAGPGLGDAPAAALATRWVEGALWAEEPSRPSRAS